MKILRVCLIFLVGFLLGALLFHLKTATAQAASSAIHIDAVPMTGPNPGMGIVTGAIVGFSCVSDTSNQSGTPGDGICYIASR